MHERPGSHCARMAFTPVRKVGLMFATWYWREVANGSTATPWEQLVHDDSHRCLCTAIWAFRTHSSGGNRHGGFRWVGVACPRAHELSVDSLNRGAALMRLLCRIRPLHVIAKIKSSNKVVVSCVLSTRALSDRSRRMA